MPPAELTTFRFIFGRCLPHAEPEARYIARLSMAMADLRRVADLLGGDIDHHLRLYLVRLMASHMFEPLSLIEPPTARQRPKSALPPLEQFLAYYSSLSPVSISYSAVSWLASTRIRPASDVSSSWT
jgi:hypothetical protein